MKMFGLMLAMVSTLFLGAADAPKLEVVKATWGAGAKNADVTKLNASRLRNGNMLYLVPGDMGRFVGDPAPMQGKSLNVVYKENGAEKTITIGEYDKPVLITVGEFPVSQDLTILNATYGNGDKTVDITELVKKQVAANQEIVIGNTTIGKDPAANVGKETMILYSIGGKLKVLTLWENSMFKPADLK